jgi:type IV pilus assembly protein PilY1
MKISRTGRRKVRAAYRRAQAARHVTATCFALIGLTCSFGSGATDIATKPVRGALLVEPNIVFAYDDSGSMDSEVLLDTTEGAVWWCSDTATAWNTTKGRPMDQPDCANVYQFRKLFPQLHLHASMGTEENPSLYRALPSIAKLAWVRSSTFNRLYYNPMVTYEPWVPVIEPANAASGTVTTYGAAVPTAARTHPSLSLHPTTPNTVDLSDDQDRAQDSDEAFRFMKGMVYPPGARQTSGSSWSVPLNMPPAGSTQTADQLWFGVPYYPATFWHPQTCTVQPPPTPYVEPDCVLRPDGQGTLKRYEIRDNGTTFPGPHSTYALQIQNFANWWQYHRKRRLMVAGVMGRVINGLGEGLRLGNLYFNTAKSSTQVPPPPPPPHPPIVMSSTTGQGGDKTRKTMSGLYYNRAWVGGAPTPTRAALEHVRAQFDSNPSIIQYACQRNYAFVVTDGFATDTGSTGIPTLADVAAAAYNTPLRAAGANALPTGKVPSGDPSRPNPDLNTNLHLNTYAISLGLRGEAWPAQDPDGDNLPNTTVNFPATPANRQKIDDLWNATIKGRGLMLLAQDAEGLSNALGRVIFDIASIQGAQGAASFSSVNLSANDFALLASYNAGRWNGDLSRRSVDPATGNVSGTETWSAAARLDALANPDSRVLFTKDGPFDVATVGAKVNPSGPAALTAAKVSYLRGARGNEGFGSNQFRPRLSRFGAVANSVPALNEARSVAFVAANDGFLHAVDTNNGNELWGFAPQGVLNTMGQSTSLTWGYRSMHDGSPTIARVAGTEMLFGSQGVGGNGWYALDVSNAAAGLTPEQRATTVKWELPGSNNTLAQQMGAAVAKPLVVKRGGGTEVVLLTSGYNAAIADGRGRLFVRDAASGVEVATLETSVVSPGTDPGLAHVSAFREVDGSVRYVYGGDEHGNLWRFDIGTSTIAPSVTRVAQLTDALGRPQAITARPALVEYQGKRIVLVGTGRLLGVTDLAPETRGNSFYAIWDNGNELANPRGTLVRQTMTVAADGTRRIESALPVNFAAQRGWFIDLPADERANIIPLVGITSVALVTNQPQSDPCTMNSYRYALDIAKGAALPDADVDGLVGTALALQHGAAGNSIIVTDGTSIGGGTPKVKHCVRGIDGSLICDDLDAAGALSPRKAGWRRIVR